MHPVEKGRFCDSCQKKVVDFSDMSDREIAAFFKKPSTGSVCGRFMTDQLDRHIEIPKRRIPWFKYFFNITWPALVVSMKATAQGQIVKKPKTEQKETCAKSMGMILPQSKKDTIPLLKERLAEHSILDDTITLKPVIVTTLTSRVVGRLIMGSSVKGIRVEENIQKDTIWNKLIKKIFPGSFRVYPNPVKSGAILNIEWMQQESGNFLLQLLDISGQLVFTKEMYIDAEARLLDLQIPVVPSGTYVLDISNKTNGAKHSQKVIIQ